MSLFNFVDFVGPAVNSVYLNALDLIRNAMSANAQGQVTLATTQDNFGRGIRVIRKKTTNTSRTTTVLSNDPDLQYVIPTGGIYYVEALLYLFGTTTGTQGMSLNLNYSASFATGTNALALGTVNGSTVSVPSPIRSNQTTISYGFSTITTTQGQDMLKLDAVISAGATGTIAISWGQNSSSANATNMGVGSVLMVSQIS